MADDKASATNASDASPLDTATSDSDKDLIFPDGIPGFEEHKRYRLHHSDTDSGRVYWMQSCDSEDIRFTLVDPAMYALNYQLELSDEEAARLQADQPEQILVLLMVWKPETQDPTQNSGLHANITGPILINADKRLGMQKLIPRPRMELNISA